MTQLAGYTHFRRFHSGLKDLVGARTVRGMINIAANAGAISNPPVTNAMLREVVISVKTPQKVALNTAIATADFPYGRKTKSMPRQIAPAMMLYAKTPK